MKKVMSVLLLCLAGGAAGCVDLPAHVARTKSVGGLPPEIDPKLPKTPAPEKAAAAPAAQETPAPARTETTAKSSPAPVTARLGGPAPDAVQPEEVTAENARQVASRLAAELDRAANECVLHGVAGCPECAGAAKR